MKSTLRGLVWFGVVMVLLMVVATVASKAHAQVTTITDPLGQFMGTLTTNGQQSVLTDAQGQVQLNFNSSAPPPPPPLPVAPMISPIAQPPAMPVMPVVPVYTPYAAPKWSPR